MDADDLLSPDLLEEMIRTANEQDADYVIPEQVHWWPDQPEKPIISIGTTVFSEKLSGREALIKSLMWEFHGRPCADSTPI